MILFIAGRYLTTACLTSHELEQEHFRLTADNDHPKMTIKLLQIYFKAVTILLFFQAQIQSSGQNPDRKNPPRPTRKPSGTSLSLKTGARLAKNFKFL